MAIRIGAAVVPKNDQAVFGFNVEFDDTKITDDAIIELYDLVTKETFPLYFKDHLGSLTIEEIEHIGKRMKQRFDDLGYNTYSLSWKTYDEWRQTAR